MFKKSSYVSTRPFLLPIGINGEVLSLRLVNEGIVDIQCLSKCAVTLMSYFGKEPLPGEYHFPNYVSFVEAIKILYYGIKVVRKITFPEGITVTQVIHLLNSNEYLVGKITSVPQEGNVFPSTYLFKYPETRQNILNLAVKTMDEFLSKEWDKRSSLCFLKDKLECLTLASIVEKESCIDSERPLIASVYLNRITKKIRLESDPTVIYALTLGEPFGRKVLLRDLKFKSPYNTYRVAGLPPTPITNPGKASIMATLHPEPTNALFFVCGSDHRHVFADTFEEHKKNKLKIKLENKRKNQMKK